VLPARCSVKPCSSIDQDDDEAPVPQRQMRKPRQRGGTSPRRSPTRSRPVKIAGPLTKPEQRTALLRQRREKQTLLEMLQRDLEREAPAAAHAWLEAGAHDGFRPDLVHRDETVHRGVVCGVGGANCWSGRADGWHVMRDEPVHGGVKCGRETQQREWNGLDAAAPDALADEQAALFLALTLDASDSTCCRNG